MNTRVVALVASVLFAASMPSLGRAQTATPSPAPTNAPAPRSGLVLPSIPPAVSGVLGRIVQQLAGDATAGYGIDPNHVRGAVTYFRRYTLQIRMPLNQYRDIQLHRGTIINPRGATIQTGSVVDVQGHPNANGTLEADAITIVRY